MWRDFSEVPAAQSLIIAVCKGCVAVFCYPEQKPVAFSGCCPFQLHHATHWCYLSEIQPPQELSYLERIDEQHFD